MTVDRNRLFEQLDPPPGGAERFRARLDAAVSGGNGRRNPVDGWMHALGARRLGATAAGAAAALALVIAVVTRLPSGSAPEEPSDAPTTTAAAAPEAAASNPAPAGGLAEAPELDWLLGRTSTLSGVSVTVRGEEAEIIEVPSSDPRIRVYMVASSSGD